MMQNAFTRWALEGDLKGTRRALKGDLALMALKHINHVSTRRAIEHSGNRRTLGHSGTQGTSTLWKSRHTRHFI